MECDLQRTANQAVMESLSLQTKAQSMNTIDMCILAKSRRGFGGRVFTDDKVEIHSTYMYHKGITCGISG